MITLKVAMAVCVGCCVVVKPAAETPLSALFLAHLVDQVGEFACLSLQRATILEVVVPSSCRLIKVFIRKKWEWK